MFNIHLLIFGGTRTCYTSDPLTTNNILIPRPVPLLTPPAPRAQFTKKSCESLGINYELRRVGAARQDQGDQPGVEIGVEEAILEANEEDGVDGIMVSFALNLLFWNRVECRGDEADERGSWAF